jgi:hypothetical protein
MALSIKTFSKMTLRIKSLFTTLSIHDTQHYKTQPLSFLCWVSLYWVSLHQHNLLATRAVLLYHTSLAQLMFATKVKVIYLSFLFSSLSHTHTHTHTNTHTLTHPHKHTHTHTHTHTHYDTQYKEIQHNDTQHKGLIYNTLHYKT